MSGAAGPAAAPLTWEDFVKVDVRVGRLVVAVVNFPPKRIAGFLSEVLVLGVYAAEDDVVLLQPDQAVAPGQRVV